MARRESGGEAGKGTTSRTDVMRRRLVDAVIGSRAAPLTVVQGPAGLGKSVLLDQVAQTAGRSQVLRITSTDQLAAYARPTNYPDDELPDLILIDDIGGVTTPAILDVHSRGPRVVVATRNPLTAVSSGMLLDGSAHIISTEDLLLTSNEVTQLASKRKIQISADEAADLHLATDGWPAMVDAALRLRRPDEPVMHRRLHELINQFVREEVLATVPGDELAKLTMTAALPQFDAHLLAATLADLTDYTEPDAALLIEHWSAAGWVIRATSAHYWRMPQPVRQNLLTELGIKHPSRRVELVDRAVRTLVQGNRTSEALPYLVEASQDVVSDVLREQENQLGTDASWALLPSVKSLADDDLVNHPALLLVAAISALLQPADLATFKLRLTQAEAVVDRSSLNASLLTLHSLQIMLARFEGAIDRAREVERSGRTFIDAATEEQRRECATRLAFFNHQVGASRLAEGDLSSAEAAFRLARTLAHHNQAHWYLAASEVLLAYTAFQNGDLPVAARMTESATALIRRSGWSHLQFTDHLYLTQGLLDLEYGRGHRATALLHRAQDRLEFDVEPPAARLAAAWSALGMLLADPVSAEHALLLCGSEFATNKLPYNRFLTAIARAQTYLVHNDPKAALAELDGVEAPSGHEAYLAITRARAQLVADAVDQAELEVAAAEQKPDLSMTIRADLHAIAAECALRRGHDALPAFRRLLASIERTGARRPILLLPQLSHAIATGVLTPPNSGRSAGLVAEIVALRRANVDGMPGLSERETEILTALAGSDTLASTAKRLYVSSNTLKTITRAVYRKLGVADRHSAVSIARTLGLLPPA
ncbi:LuxR C-terminal-related transcriptional regulator [Phytoactinopolyspora mesophila]|uniref:HTH luxR-type domain-containing protein n=1 Tax=Phytoactinopolyspora mesophila TaxID=2650750 RepID=A0A7K3M5K7_9ACTN|nr:LuxR C-terminal-related transcriptional regulator [Phytoactinopolyspora mesophila]NDL58593.1 hypothetical protein [Phytoactinopolyspora mesophila]